MCRPPDLTPAAGGLAGDDFSDVVEDWNNDGSWDSGDYEVAASDAAVATVLGKRETNEDGSIADALSRAAKLPRAAAPVSSAFDSAAASFVARMEQSMLQDLQRQQQIQQQRRLAAAGVEGEDSLLLHQALAEQRAKLQQLQQLQLLKQLQKQKQQAALSDTTKILPEQQQLLLAQLQLLQQSQGNLRGAVTPAAVAAAVNPQAAAWASLLKQQQAAAAPVAPVAALWGAQQRLSAESKIQAWMGNGLQGTSAAAAAQAAVVPLAPKSLPALHPKPVTAAAAAVFGTELNPAAAMFGLGAVGRPALGSACLGIGEEKKAKRMLSNRASAKRSRQRRQARLEELDKTTAVLQMEKSTVCTKLEQAQREILKLEAKNRSLVGEVTRLRKILGMEAPAFEAGKKGETAVSGAGQQQSCIDSEACTPGSVVQSPVHVKGEVESEVAFGDVDEAAEGEEDDDEENDTNLDWMDAMPLSPTLKADSPLCGLVMPETDSEGI